MKCIVTWRQWFGRSIAVLLLLAVAMVGLVTLDRMDMAMASGSHDMTMAMEKAHADQDMSTGSAHAACQIICVGMTPAVSAAMLVAASRLIVGEYAPSVKPLHNGRSPDPALRPPQIALTT